MSDGHREGIRGSHHNSERAADPEPASAAAGTNPGAADYRVRQSTDVIIGWRVWGFVDSGLDKLAILSDSAVDFS